MNLWLDTSAILAVLDADDINHKKAKRIWSSIIANREIIITSNYILLETISILQNRLGLEAVRTFQFDLLPLLNIAWINEADHNAGIMSVLTSGKRKLSLVDCTSFEVMNRLSLTRVFTFDKHFKEQGFDPLA